MTIRDSLRKFSNATDAIQSAAPAIHQTSTAIFLSLCTIAGILAAILVVLITIGGK